MARSDQGARPDRSEAAIQRVREAEATARSRVADTQQEAHRRTEQAHDRARAIEARAEQRIRKIHEAVEGRLFEALAALHEDENAPACAAIGTPRARQRAVIAVARRLAGLDPPSHSP